MSTGSTFYYKRAEEAAHEAEIATLANVRERALRAEATWRAMADRAVAVEENIRSRNEASRLITQCGSSPS